MWEGKEYVCVRGMQPEEGMLGRDSGVQRGGTLAAGGNLKARRTTIWPRTGMGQTRTKCLVGFQTTAYSGLWV